MSTTDIVSAMTAYKQQTVAPGAFYRQMVHYEGWHVPSKTLADGSVGLWMFPGSTGEWWVCAFSSRQVMDSYAQVNGLQIGESFFVTKGGSLLRNLPGGARGLGLDLASHHGVAIFARDLPLLQELGQAVLVEEILAGTSQRANQHELLREYAGYRVFWQGQQPLLAPDPQGRRLVAVFTAEDTFEAFRAQQNAWNTPHTKLDGGSLFGQLRAAPVDGVVFNCAGPIAPSAVGSGFASSVMQSAEGSGVAAAPASLPLAGPTAAQSQGSPQFGAPMASPGGDAPQFGAPMASPSGSAPQFGAPMASPAASSPAAAPMSQPVPSTLALTEYVPRLVRQDHPAMTQGAVARPLVSPPDPTQPIISPMICLAAETAQGTQYATAKTLGTRSLDELVGEGARQLVGKNPPEIHLVGEPPVLSLHGEHASEAVLVPGAMMALHKQLASEMVVVAIPVRGVVIACAMQNTPALLRLASLADKSFRAAGAQGLYPHPLLLKDGKVLGRVSVEVEEKPAAPVPTASPATEAPRRARSLAECGLYLNLCDYPVGGRKESMSTQGDDVVVQYDCTKEGGPARRFLFLIGKADMVATGGDGPMRYGAGDKPSELVDAGQFFDMAEAFAKASPGSLDGLTADRGMTALRIIERAAACMDEVIKFIPAGEEMVPDRAFFTASGRHARAQQPAGRWSRARLGAIGGAYRSIADQFRQEAHQKGWLYN